MSLPASTTRHQLALSDAYGQLEKTTSLDEIKSIRDKAEAIRGYAQNARLGLHAQNQAAELKLQAERKAGKLLSEMHLQGGDRKSNGHPTPATLADLGIERWQSQRWQKEALLPEDDFKRFVEETNSRNVELTSAELLRRASHWATENDPNRSNGESNSQDDEATEPTPFDETDESLPKLADILDTITELKGHHELVTNLLNSDEPDSPPKTKAERALHRYVSEMGKFVVRLEQLLSR